MNSNTPLLWLTCRPCCKSSLAELRAKSAVKCNFFMLSIQLLFVSSHSHVSLFTIFSSNSCTLYTQDKNFGNKNVVNLWNFFITSIAENIFNSILFPNEKSKSCLIAIFLFLPYFTFSVICVVCTAPHSSKVHDSDSVGQFTFQNRDISDMNIPLSF